MMHVDPTSPFEVSLDSADFRGDFAAQPAPPEAQAALADALDRAQTHYVDVAGIRPLRAAVADYLTRLDIPAPDEQVVISNGDQEARLLSLRIAAQPGRRLAVPAVADPGVRAALGMGRLEAVEMAGDPAAGFLPGLAHLRAALDDGCRVIYLESPHRLTGFIYSAEQVSELAQWLAATTLWQSGTRPPPRP
jgi:aspartate/methionine/tyrosine aminotransferase